MKVFKVINLIVGAVILFSYNIYAQTLVGYHDAPYTRYEADKGTLTSATITAKSFAQGNVQSEASERICVNMSSSGASVAWTVTAAGDGLVVRYSVPDGQSGGLEVFSNNVSVGTLTLSSNWSWQYLSTTDANITNTNPKMRFDEVRLKLGSKIPAGGTLKLVRTSGNIQLDFAELEAVPAAVTSTGANVSYSGDGSTLQSFIDANGGKIIYIPAGVYNVNRELYLGVNNTTLRGAGAWYTQIHFTNGGGGAGGLRANASGISYSGLYLTTVRNERSSSYKAINGVYTSTSKITDVWAEHFECGAWIGQYNTGGPSIADGFTMSNCRFRNNYADGINLCKGTSNAIVEHCNFRNNGDDDMAIWSANGQECKSNTFRYNTSEHCWRASGCAIYGGYSNKAYNLLIQDNVEVGIRVNNAFGGVGFNSTGTHELYNIIIKRCGTFSDLYNTQVGAIDLGVYDWGAGLRVQNVKFSCIDIIDAGNDAIYVKKVSGDGFYNVVFENIRINGTGREYPDNGTTGTGRGYMVLFKGSPAGNISYCGMSYTNRGGNVGTDVGTGEKGSLSWTAGSCVACDNLVSAVASSSTTITSSSTFGICDNPVTISATNTVPAGSTVTSVQFYVDNVSKGTDNSAPYSVQWSGPTIGTHSVYAVTTYSGGTTSTSPTQTLTVADGMYSTTTAPAIDGSMENIWNNFPTFSLNKVSVGTVTNAADLSATFKVMRDATNFYLLVDVTDDILRNDGTANWQKDAVEIFIDMGNDKNTSYVANNDFQYTFVWDVLTAQTGVTFAQTTKAGNTGYIVEVKIPWATLGGAPAAGTFMGFDVHVDDNDSGDRNGKIAWTDGTDNAWQNPAVLGTVQIAGCQSPYIAPVSDFTFTPATGCSGQTVTFTDASTTATSWSWDFGSGATPAKATTQGPHNVVYATTGTKVVTLTVSNNAGSNLSSKTVTVITVPAQPGAISGSVTPCSGTTTTYSIAPVSGATSYTWTLPVGWTGTSTGTTITPTTTANAGNISVVANNACGASTLRSLSVTPSTVPAQPGVITGPTGIAANSTNVYSIAAVAGATSYTWSLPTGWTGSSVTTSLSATAGSVSGNVLVAASNACGASPTQLLAVKVCAPIDIPNTIQAEDYCDMNGVQLEVTTDTNGGQNVGYLDGGDWMSYKINVLQSGSYIVQYRVASNLTGKSFQLQSPGGATVYGSIDVPFTGDWQNWQTIKHTVALTAGVQDVVIYTSTGGFNVNWIDFTIATGVPETVSGLFSIYPNPASDFVIVKSPADLRELLITDATGRVVYKIAHPGNDFKINFEGLPAGFYTVVATDINFNKQTTKLIK